MCILKSVVGKVKQYVALAVRHPYNKLKPIGESNGEELVLTGRTAGKASNVRKTDSAAADLELSNG